MYGWGQYLTPLHDPIVNLQRHAHPIGGSIPLNSGTKTVSFSRNTDIFMITGFIWASKSKTKKIHQHLNQSQDKNLDVVFLIANFRKCVIL